MVSAKDIGFSGLYGNVCANLAIMKSDLLIVLGSRLAKRQIGIQNKYAINAKVIHIDVNPEELNRVLKADIALCGDVKQFLVKLNSYIIENKVDFHYDKWVDYLCCEREKHYNDVEFNDSNVVNFKIIIFFFVFVPF